MLFESCVGEVAVAMKVASIFYFEFWALWGVVLSASFVAFWRPLWILRASLGVFWGHLGVRWVPWTSFWLLWGALGVLCGSLGVPGKVWGVAGAIFEFSGKFREAFWLHFEVIFVLFLIFFWALFFC